MTSHAALGGLTPHARGVINRVKSVIVERPLLERRVATSLDAGRIPVLLGGCGSGRTSLLLRLEHTIGPTTAQYIDFAAAATTPERCLAAIAAASRLQPASPPAPARNPPEGFAGLMAFFDGSAATTLGATFLVDEFLDVRTFENFPGLRHVQRDLIARLTDSPSRFVLASRFTVRVHRLLRDAPARFEVIHMPPLDGAEVQAMAQLFGGERPDWAADVAPSVAALVAGAPAPAHILLAGLAAMAPATDPVAALAAAMAPDGALTALCRHCYELRLHRARGYGALKAILGVLADDEPLNLTDISHRLGRTPGSTKDYLSWLEDVDLVTMHGKRYAYTDPLLRLYVRLYGQPVPPGDNDLVREVGAYARARLLPVPAPAPTPAGPAQSPAAPAATEPAPAQRSGIIEID